MNPHFFIILNKVKVNRPSTKYSLYTFRDEPNSSHSGMKEHGLDHNVDSKSNESGNFSAGSDVLPYDPGSNPGPSKFEIKVLMQIFYPFLLYYAELDKTCLFLLLAFRFSNLQRLSCLRMTYRSHMFEP